MALSSDVISLRVRTETKEALDRPTSASGETEPLSPSPVAPASQSTTLSLSEPGEKPKRRGRPPKQS